jgi:hypothetical protein
VFGARPFVKLTVACLLVLLAIAYALGVFEPPTAHLAALVPDDAVFAVVSSSVNDLRQLYRATYQTSEYDAARTRLGQPVNVPGLVGIDYDRPVGSYFRRDDGLVYLVPVADLDAFKSAHDKTRENINIKAPVRVAKHYVSLAETAAVATIGPDNRMVLEACQYPLALVGHPRAPFELRAMLAAFFGPESPPPTPQLMPLAAMLARMPDPIATIAAGEIDRFRLAVCAHAEGDPAVRFDLLIDPARNSHLAAAAEYAGGMQVSDLLGVLPAGHKMNTILGAAAMLNGESWQSLGLPINVGPAAAMIAIVELKYRAGRHTVVFALAPTNERAFERIAQTSVLGLDPAAATVIPLTGAEIRLQEIEQAPAAFDAVFATDANTPPKLHLCRARIGSAWYCTLGAHAEEVMRAIADGAAGATPAVMSKLFGGIDKKIVPTAAHPNFFRKGLVAAAFATAEVPKALAFPFPYIQTASIGTPEAFTVTIEPDGDRIHAELMAFRAERE